MVRCMIVGLEQKRKTKKITLSMRASLLNKEISKDNLMTGAHFAACVASKEDKGYVINLGLDENTTTGFLAFKEVADSDSMDVDDDEEKNNGNKQNQLVIGQPIECVVLSNNSSVVFVTTKQSIVRSTITKSFSVS
jgi:hypothetical protein